MKITRIMNPISAASKLVFIASAPSFAPTTLNLKTSSSIGSAPIRIVVARSSASSNVLKPPSIIHSPSVIGLRTEGDEITVSS